MPLIHILLIDDHALFRYGLALVLRDGFDDIKVWQVASLEAAMQDALMAPDIVLLDVQLQGLSGLEGIALLHRRWPKVPVVMLSSHAEPHTVRLAVSRGAAAFVSKADTPDKIVSVIRALVSGEAVATTAQGWHDSMPAGQDGVTIRQRLTPRQAEVLNLLAQGLPNKAIGRRLDLSDNTVRGHVQALLATLGVSSRSEAIFAARQMGLIS